MRKLTIKEIEKFARRKGVRRIAVENFLMSMGEVEINAVVNLEMDAELYNWNKRTIKAIEDGMDLASEGTHRPSWIPDNVL